MAENGKRPAAGLADALRATFADCYDLETRTIAVGGAGGLAAELFYLDGLVSGGDMSDYVLRPLTERARFRGARTPRAAAARIMAGAVYDFNARLAPDAAAAADDLLSGFCCLVFADGTAVSFEVKTGDKRAVDQPKEEKVVRGSKDAFVEVLKVNTMLVRRKIRDRQLKIRALELGGRTRTKTALVYLEGFTNEAVLREAERRLRAIDAEEVLSPAVITENIADRPRSLFPQVLVTERPDKFCLNLLEGRVGILADGLPMGFLVPATFAQFMKVPEDHASHFLIASFLTALRYAAFFLALILPAFYVAVAMYHQEMIPVKLLRSIINAKQAVPFPTAFETLLMLFAFELLQEAGLRLPNPVGQTVSIIGALIVGQSAVEARVVSPVVVVVVALSGICGYIMPDLDMGSGVRILRFLLVLAAILAGMFGVAMGFTMIVYHLAGLESFGVPYMSPFAGGEGKHLSRALLRWPMDRKRDREPELRPGRER